MPAGRARALVRVAVPVPVEGLFTYAVPEGMELVVGHAVLVPFGTRTLTGYVIEPADEPVPRMKAVRGLADPVPAFGPDQLAFFQWIAGYYQASLGEVIATALPVAYKSRSRRVLVPTDLGIEAIAARSLDLDPVRATVLREVISRPGRTRAGLVRTLHSELDKALVDRTLNALLGEDLVAVDEREAREAGGKVRTASLAVPVEALQPTVGARMRGVLARLVEAGGTLDVADLVAAEGPGAREAIRRLEERGDVSTGHREDTDPVTEGELVDSGSPPPLNADQQAAVEAITAAADGTFLLHGVTGSGKTEVYLRAAARTLQEGRQVLVLVPEIALTPLLCGRFRARFPDAIAVLHSGLTPAERLREWRRIRAGEAQVVVGARSALFAPFGRLGLIVVDEEHDGSFKQDDGVRYNARDLAVVRGRLAGCPVVLGSATPSLETWANARDGRYRRLTLPRRATPRAVPAIELVDMRGLPGRQALAVEVVDALRKAFDQGGKAIVLYNRRGYAPVVQCPDCGGGWACPSCEISLVYHQRRGRLVCHYCGLTRPWRPDCPACGADFEVTGHGTERIEEVLVQTFPDIGIGRMDADTTSGRGAHHRILSAFRDGDFRLLVGTQLVAKGHDFPDVHLAVVLGVDHILGMPDFRSAERTYGLVTQLAGRAGRGDVAGRVLVQTRHVEHFVFRLLAAGEVSLDAFYEHEARQRQLLRYPPASRLVLLRLEGADRGRVHDAANSLAEQLRGRAERGSGVDVLGPAAAPLSRLVGRWRVQIVIRGTSAPAFRRWLGAAAPILRAAQSAGAGVRTIIDVDPRHLL